MNKNNRIKILLIVLIFVIAGIVFSCISGAKKAEESEVAAITEEAASVPETKAAAEAETEKICVHVCGNVLNPGVYYLASGARVHEAVELAGGMTEDADSRYVNLAEEAEDGSQIYIPSKEEVEAGVLPETGQSLEADDGLVNINTATADELTSLPGIGSVKANAVIAYRESAGGFQSVEEIMNVAGIKENSYEKIKEYIKV